MSSRRGVMVGLSVLAFVAVAFALFWAKSMFQVSATNSASIACMNEAKAHPSDRLAMDRCLKARGVLVEDSPPPGSRASRAPLQADPYAACLQSADVKKHTQKSMAWALALSSCMENYGQTAVVTMHRNPATGDIEYGISR